jgi:hypothetical protein
MLNNARLVVHKKAARPFRANSTNLECPTLLARSWREGGYKVTYHAAGLILPMALTRFEKTSLALVQRQVLSSVLVGIFQVGQQS